ncbi:MULTISPECIES: hypothetical protein [Hungatella]|uniref:hypothetical protein n=1 Tax=Hungatella TaxID=1649459 RepID=UPI0015F3BEE5|nr:MULTISPECIES: hypothetical protein [Hungatella]
MNTLLAIRGKYGADGARKWRKYREASQHIGDFVADWEDVDNVCICQEDSEIYISGVPSSVIIFRFSA